MVVLLLGAAPASAKKQKKPPNRYRLPVARGWMPERKINAPHHDYPAWDLAIPKRTAVRAVHAGRVRSVTRGGGCGRGMIIAGRDGYQYTYCHGSWVLTKKHGWVRAGQKIMLSGSTGHSTGPHLHLQIRGPRGRLLCPQPLLKRWANGRQASPRVTTSKGCAYSPDRAIYRSHPHGRRGARAATARSARPGGGGKARGGHGHDRGRPGKRHAKGPGTRHAKGPGRRPQARDQKKKHRRDREKKHRRRHRSPRVQRERRKQRRIAQRRRRWRARAEQIRAATAARRAELALARRVRPLI